MTDYRQIIKDHEPDYVNHPTHYTKGHREVIDIIDDILIQAGYNAQDSMCIGNLVKYICRANHKNNALQDLKKGAWYLNRVIENYKKEVSSDQTEPLNRKITSEDVNKLENAMKEAINKYGERVFTNEKFSPGTLRETEDGWRTGGIAIKQSS